MRATGDGEQDTTGCDGEPDKRPHSSTLEKTPFVRTAFGAVTDGEDAMVKLRFARCWNHPILVSVETGVVSLDGDGHGLLTHG